jgi:hypothetical protein
LEKNLKKLSPVNRKSLLTLCVILVSLSHCSHRKYEGLLTWEEYLKKSKKIPYILELETRKGSLVYYGSIHRFDPRYPQFADIEKRWKEFKPTLALCEGCIWPLEDSRKHAISLYGEGGLMRFLADKNRIPIQCIDPGMDKEAMHLIRFFSADNIKLYYILRQALINRSRNKDIKNTNYVRHILRQLSNLKGFKGNPSTFDEFECTVYKMLPNLTQWQSIPCSSFYSNSPENFLAKIHLKLNEYRDQHMIRILLNELKKGKRVFAVVGRSHVIKQEPVLRSEIIHF